MKLNISHSSYPSGFTIKHEYGLMDKPILKEVSKDANKLACILATETDTQRVKVLKKILEVI